MRERRRTNPREDWDEKVVHRGNCERERQIIIKQLLDEVEQNIVICQWRADQLFATIIVLSFNHQVCFHFFFFFFFLGGGGSGHRTLLAEINWFPSQLNNLFCRL